MPTQVVVVKRARARAFEILRSAPAWMRAVWATGWGGADDLPPELERALARLPGSGSVDPRGRAVALPRLVDDAATDGCPDCRRCVAACPSEALALGLPDEDGPEPMLLLELDPGRCIGCGECVRVCPDDLLELAVGEARVGEGAGPAAIDLVPRPEGSGNGRPC